MKSKTEDAFRDLARDLGSNFMPMTLRQGLHITDEQELEEDNFVATRCKAWVFFEMVRYDEAISVMKNLSKNLEKEDLGCIEN